jgi:hypothetical protein
MYTTCGIAITEVTKKAMGKNYKQLKKFILCRFYVISMAGRLLNTNSRIF